MNELLAALMTLLQHNQHLTSPVPSPMYAQQPLQHQVVPTPTPSVDQIIKNTFGNDYPTARAIAMQESTLGKNKINKSNPNVVGLYQIDVNAHAHRVPGQTKQDKINYLMDDGNNARVAKQIYDEQGFRPWEAYTSGRYKKYL